MSNGTKVADNTTTTTTSDLALRPGRRRVARRVIEAMIDEALDRAQAPFEQRARIYRVRNRTLATIDAYLEDSDAARCPTLVEAELREQARRCFADDATEAALGATAAWRGDDRRLAETIARSVRDVYAVLTPPQRRAIGDYVRDQLSDRL